MAHFEAVTLAEPIRLGHAQVRIRKHNPQLDLKAGIESDKLEVLEFFGGSGERRATFVLGRLARKVLRVYAVHADTQRGDIVAEAMEPLESLARERGCQQIAIDTYRPGMLAKLARHRRLIVQWIVLGE